MKKLITLLMAFALTLSLAACATGGEPSGNVSDPAPQVTAKDPFEPYPETVTVRIARMGVSGNNLPDGDKFESNKWLKWCEEKLNIKIEFAYIGADTDSYNTRINLMMTSGLPDALFVDRKQYETLVEAGLLADMTTIIPEYSSELINDYYNSYDGKIIDYAKIDGKVWGIPSTVIAGSNQLLYVRKDWREKLNLSEPKTMDDVRAIANAFVTQDPDGNGADDTIGLLGSKEIYVTGGSFVFDPVFAAYDSFPGVYLKDDAGEVYYGSTQPETKVALQLLADMYKEGSIDKEMVSKDWNANYGSMTSNKAGIFFYPWHGGWAASDVIKTNPEARWELYAAPENSEGKVVCVNPEPVGQYLVVNKDYEHPELIMKLMSTQYQGLRELDEEAKQIYKDLGVSWLNWPVPLELNYRDTVAETSAKVIKAYETNNTEGLTQAQIDNNLRQYKEYMEEAPDKDPGMWANGFAHVVAGNVSGDPKFTFIDQAYYGTTETMSMKGANLKKLENETFLKIIIGEKPIDEFDSFVEKWEAEGGKEIIAEIQEAIS